ncbi:TPA: hypothetical protein ACX6S8_003807, partial [Photobacterium damselae]
KKNLIEREQNYSSSRRLLVSVVNLLKGFLLRKSSCLLGLPFNELSTDTPIQDNYQPKNATGDGD